MHVPAGHENGLIIQETPLPLGLNLEKLPHGSRVHSPATPRVIQHQASRAELAGAGLQSRPGMTLTSADAGPDVSVHIQNRGILVQQGAFQQAVIYAVGIDDVRLPMSDSVHYRIYAELARTPGRHIERQRIDVFGAVGRCSYTKPTEWPRWSSAGINDCRYFSTPPSKPR